MNPFQRSLSVLAARRNPNTWRDYDCHEEPEEYEDDQDEETDEGFAARMAAQGLVWKTDRWVNK